MPLTRLFPVALLIGACVLAPNAAQAGQSYDNCDNFIDALPVTITTQGVSCLRKDLSTLITNGVAIKINANNVTIDCNDFKIGGLGGGDSSLTTGIGANFRQNVTIKNCGIRGFLRGISIGSGAGHLVENNRLDYNRMTGIELYDGASHTIIRNNRIYDTGGFPQSGTNAAMDLYAGDGIEVRDNAIAGVVGADGYNNDVIGISRDNFENGVRIVSSRISGNSISQLSATGSGIAKGFYNANSGITSGRVALTNNHVVLGKTQTGSIGVDCNFPGVSTRENTVSGFATNLGAACRDNGANDTY